MVFQFFQRLPASRTIVIRNIRLTYYASCSNLRTVNDPTILILTSLSSGERHGYALQQDIERFAGVRLGPGTLYGAIGRLEERGLIEPVGDDGRRRTYRLTAAGVSALERSLHQMRTIVEEGTAGLAHRPAPATLKAAGAVT
jgi:DNA-binding PadR family transcriptional regulator